MFLRSKFETTQLQASSTMKKKIHAKVRNDQQPSLKKWQITADCGRKFG